MKNRDDNSRASVGTAIDHGQKDDHRLKKLIGGREPMSPRKCGFAARPPIRDMSRILIFLITVLGITLSNAVLAASAQQQCQSFGPPSASDTIVTVSSASELTNAVQQAQAGTTIFLYSATYQISSTLYLNKPRISIRSVPGNKDDVVIDANYQGGSIIHISAENITVADVTLRRAWYHPVQIGG